MKKRFFTLLSLLTMLASQANPVITFFFRPYPTDDNHLQEMSDALQRPGKLAHHTLHGILDMQTISGIFSTYAGFLGTSNLVGQTDFPRKQEKPLLYLIFTEQITPMMMAGNTIHHWELDPLVPTAVYKYEQKEDPATKLYYWNVEQAALPTDPIIPLDSIVVFIKPKNVYIPTGITISRNDPNLVLPEIYVKKGIKIYPSTLYVLNLKQFYGAINHLYQKRDNGYNSLIKNY